MPNLLNITSCPLRMRSTLHESVERQTLALGAARELGRQTEDIQQAHDRWHAEASFRVWENEGGSNVG